MNSFHSSFLLYVYDNFKKRLFFRKKKYRLIFGCNRISKIVLCYFFFIGGLDSHLLTAQKITDLEAERKELLNNIKQTSKLLNTTKTNQAAVIDEFYTIQRQIEQRAKLIETLQKETNQATLTMELSAMAVDSLEMDMDKLKIEYAAMVRQAFRFKMGSNELAFLFSATDFNQALRRWRYIQQYDEYRKRQVQLILETQKALKEQIRWLELNKNSQEQLLLSEEAQKETMLSELSYKSQILDQLKKDEQKISSLLREQKRAHEELNQAVESLISADITRQEERKAEEKKPIEGDKNNTANSLSADLAYQFSLKKGTLAWPIQNGVITRYFGNQAHPIHKKIMINNNGIDIHARSNKTVFSVFEGVVTAIQAVPGYRNTIILQHGDYYSVYSNLEFVKVRKGDIVMEQQVIGEVGISNQKEYPELHLEIWKGKTRLNPFGWLQKL